MFSSGNEDSTSEIVLTAYALQTFVFEDIREEPVASILRGFSAPVSCVWKRT